MSDIKAGYHKVQTSQVSCWHWNVSVMEESLDIPIWDLPARFHHDLTPTGKHATMTSIQATTAIVSKVLETMRIWPIEVDCHT